MLRISGFMPCALSSEGFVLACLLRQSSLPYKIGGVLILENLFFLVRLILISCYLVARILEFDRSTIAFFMYTKAYMAYG